MTDRPHDAIGVEYQLSLHDGVRADVCGTLMNDITVLKVRCCMAIYEEIYN